MQIVLQIVNLVKQIRYNFVFCYNSCDMNLTIFYTMNCFHNIWCITLKHSFNRVIVFSTKLGLQKLYKTIDRNNLLCTPCIKETYVRQQTSRHINEKYMRNNANFYDMRCIRLSMTSNFIFFNIGKIMLDLTDQKDLLYYPKDVSRDILESFWNLDSVLKLYLSTFGSCANQIH